MECVNTEHMGREKKEEQKTNECVVHVGNLPAYAPEEELYRLFASAGSIISLNKIEKERPDGTVIRFALITYLNAAEVEKAIDLLNYHVLNGKEIRVQKFLKMDKVQKQSEENLIIKGLPADIDDQSFEDTFSIFGRIVSSRISKNVLGVCVGFGFVKFESVDAARVAKEMINKCTINGEKLSASVWVPQSERTTKKGLINNTFTNVYFKDIPPSVPEEEVQKELEKIGKLTSFFSNKDEKGAPTGVYFANFSTHEEALKAIEALGSKPFPGVEYTEGMPPVVYAARAKPKIERDEEKVQDTRVIFVRNFPSGITDEEISEYFSAYGKIVSMNIVKPEAEKDKKTLSYGFITYDTNKEMKAAIEGAHDKLFKNQLLSVVESVPRSMRAVEKYHQPYQKYSGRYGTPGYSKAPSTKPGPRDTSNMGYELYELILSLAPNYKEKIEQAGFQAPVEFAMKITGMILELDEEEIKKASKLGNVLSSYVEESLDELIQAQKKEKK
ncbi:polyadenylate-binding protein [Nematocida sp. AWRm77]|nr:polyadenylate-binding protein [Nematocida sp. AWRm77]